MAGRKARGLRGEAVEDRFAGRDFDEMEDGQCEQNQDGVGEPGIQGGEMKALGHMVVVEELEDVEVEEVEAVAALANQEERTPGEERGDWVGTAKSDDESGEDWGQEAAVHEEVGGVAYQGVEEESGGGEAEGGENETLAWSEGQGELQLAERYSGEEGADVGERGVFEETEELGGAVAVDGADDVVWVQIEIERVGDETDDPEGEKEKDELSGLLGPG